MLDRLQKAAHALVVALGLVDPPPPERCPPGKISELDAWRFIGKTLRELRQAIAVGSPPVISDLAKDVAEHLGASNVKAIAIALETEKAAFEDDFIAGAEKLGEHAHFHEDHGAIDRRAASEPPPSEKFDAAALKVIKAG